MTTAWRHGNSNPTIIREERRSNPPMRRMLDKKVSMVNEGEKLETRNHVYMEKMFWSSILDPVVIAAA
ncbi:hypothetical protein AKJ16_DCAP18952 [Drosera capensis]